MASIRDVAEKAGVSTATVSRVLNKDERVKDETRAKIQAVIDELGYRPNRLATSLRRQDSNLVALFLENQKSPFATMLYASIEKTLHDEGFKVLSCCTRGEAERERKYTQTMIEMQVAGAIVRPSNSAAETLKNVKRLQANDIPTVYVDILPGRRSESFVVCDNTEGGRIGMRYLVALGHKHIGVLATKADHDPRRESVGNLRMRGILEVACEYLIEKSVYLPEPNERKRYDLGYATANELLDQNPEITALFAITDTAAIGAMHACFDRGLRVPEDISILGYDGIPISSITSPQLSTIQQPIAEMGASAARYIIEKIRNPSSKRLHETKPVELKQRRSVSHPRKGSLPLSKGAA
ncbi:LacI family DNA-binding transcriptional regulator [Pseudovibrio sp. WM33]|uniref:LacI family DNA-binding transcriptional regulator n=1 Tax=Pseudovibrio sp. WM33 TaxID=1735585 RepID=UPI0007AE49D9|nr:LacI family DNA-binding transcriptional regulator [Pseudovibrio sp. WM33]KZL28990.1 HTH-type transcriptional regulator DegA [Pseudovibrio sp. WM33]